MTQCDICGHDGTFGQYLGKNYCRACTIKLVEEML